VQHAPVGFTKSAAKSTKILALPRGTCLRLMRTGSIAALCGAIALVVGATPVLAQPEVRTKLVHCGPQDCLQISGYRADPSLSVSLNGHDVTAEGERGWRVQLPVETIRQLSSPNASTIEVSLRHPRTQQRTLLTAELPIGLLGDVTQIASLEVRAP